MYIIMIPSLKGRFIIGLLYAWGLVKRELVLNTNKLCVDIEKTSGKVHVVLC